MWVKLISWLPLWNTNFASKFTLRGECFSNICMHIIFCVFCFTQAPLSQSHQSLCYSYPWDLLWASYLQNKQCFFWSCCCHKHNSTRGENETLLQDSGTVSTAGRTRQHLPQILKNNTECPVCDCLLKHMLAEVAASHNVRVWLSSDLWERPGPGRGQSSNRKWIKPVEEQ